MCIVIVYLEFVARNHQDTRCHHTFIKTWVIWPLIMFVSVGVQNHNKTHAVSCFGVLLCCPGGVEQKCPIDAQLQSVGWASCCRGESISWQLLKGEILISLDNLVAYGGRTVFCLIVWLPSSDFLLISQVSFASI